MGVAGCLSGLQDTLRGSQVSLSYGSGPLVEDLGQGGGYRCRGLVSQDSIYLSSGLEHLGSPSLDDFAGFGQGLEES